MEIKFAHTSDFHIGAKCKGIGNKSEIRKYEITNAFINILKISSKENIDILFIAGDLFDDTKGIQEEDINIVKKSLGDVNFNVVISPGNHDPFTSDSPYCSQWPNNVFIFKDDKLDFIEFNDLNLRVWGHAFKSSYERKHLLKDIKLPQDDFINICVMHGNLFDGNNNNAYAPITYDEVKNCCMDYIALGHIHKKSEPKYVGKTCYTYCGCPEATGFDETGEKGFYIGKISKNFCNLTFKSCSKRNYEVLNLDITNLESDFDVAELIIMEMKKNYKEKYIDNIYKVVLSGEISENFFINTLKIETYLNDRVFFASLSDNTETRVDIDELKFRNDFKSIFIKKMMLKIENSKNDYEKHINRQALKIGLRAFREEVKYSDN